MSLRVAVVSIGRSGTSLISRILHEVLRVDFGNETDHIPRDYNNADGYFENAEFFALNERILKAAGASLLSPPPVAYLSTLASTLHDAFVKEAAMLLAKFAGQTPAFGWKDPRLSLTFPIWQAACPSVVPIIPFRKPVSVLSSISSQFDRPLESLSHLWFAYYQRVFSYTEETRRHILNFDNLLAEPAQAVMCIARHLGIHVDPTRVQKQLTEIVKLRQPRHLSVVRSADHSPTLEPQTFSLYDYLCASTMGGGQPDAHHLQTLIR
jgi:hypothetical protein